jgi:hypothetical protein
MEKEFISYEQALALKELGFDEICLAYYDENKEHYYFISPYLNINDDNVNTIVLAPLYQQAFRWFRGKYNLFGYSYPNDYQMYGYRIVELKSSENKELIYDWGTLNTHEEAELECLKKLIEIVKENNNG